MSQPTPDPAQLTAATALPDPSAEIRAARSHVLRRVAANPLGLVALVVLAAVVLLALLAPVLAHHDPGTASATAVLEGPSGKHLLGTDGAGRDVWARLLYASRYSLAGAAEATAVAMLLGITSGLLAGYYGRRLENVSAWLVSLLMALPGIVVLLAIRAVLGPSLWLAMAVFGVLLAPAFYRLVFAAVTAVKNELFVDAARVSGVGDASIVARHILTVVRAPVIIQASIVTGIAIAIQSGLDFLGFGDQSIPTWGNLLNDGFTNMYRQPLLMLWPGLAIGLTSIALTLFANALRDELERSGGAAPRRRRTRVAGAVGAAGTVTGTATGGVLAPELGAPASTEGPGTSGEAGAPASWTPTIVHAEAVATEPGAAREELLRVSDLAVGYRQGDGSVKRVVQDVSLVLHRGEVHGLIGESGSGKTQTAWSVLRLLPPGGEVVGGSIVFDGRDLAHQSDREMTWLRGRRIAYVPQEPMSNLDATFTIGSQLVEPMRVTLGLSRARARARALDLLARVGIPDPQRTYSSYPHEISGGMAQRVLIAGAVSCEPDLLIADEPTTALDVTVQADILDLLRSLRTELDVAVLLVTHDFGVVADLCDRVSVMQEGRIVETGPVRSLFADPRHPYTRSLFDAILEDGAARGTLGASGGTSGGPPASDRHLTPGGTR